MFHVELRQFPHAACAFNLSEDELERTIVGPWSREERVELGERKWSPHQARLTVLEGPRLQVADLAMGRGWRNAQQRSEDVTKRVLARASAVEGADGTLLALLGGEGAALLAAWRLAAQRHPELAPSECLALAEATLRSLDAGG